MKSFITSGTSIEQEIIDSYTAGTYKSKSKSISKAMNSIEERATFSDVPDELVEFDGELILQKQEQQYHTFFREQTIDLAVKVG